MQQQGKAALLHFTGFFSGKIAPPTEKPHALKEEMPTSLPCAGFFRDNLAPANEERVTLKEGKTSTLS